MPTLMVDLTGRRFGKLVVLEKAEPPDYDLRHSYAYWKCRCDCGKERLARADFLQNGSFHSCADCPSITDEGEYMRYTAANGRSFIFDKEDLPHVEAHRWSVSPEGYVHCSNAQDEFFNLPCILLGVESCNENCVTRINGDCFDNRKPNLRVADRTQRCAIRKLYANNTTGYKGVSYDKKGRKYTAHICKHKKLMHLGRFDSAWEAAVAYDVAAKELFGEFAVTNEVLARRRAEAEQAAAQ